MNSIVIDLDHTICIPDLEMESTFGRYALAKPVPEIIDKMKELKYNGYKIIISTSRIMLTHDGDINKIVDKKNLDHSKSEGNPTYMYMNELEILSLAIKSGVRHVVFTGGEPCMYDLTNVTRTLLQYRPSNLYDYFTVQIETSGTFEIRCDPNTWVTVSPKIGKTVQGGYKVRGDSYYRANELKYPVGKMADIESLKTVLNLHQGLYDRNKRNKNIPIWLQPLSTSEKATELCVEQAILNDWRISIQTHKFINAR